VGDTTWAIPKQEQELSKNHGGSKRSPSMTRPPKNNDVFPPLQAAAQAGIAQAEDNIVGPAGNASALFGAGRPTVDKVLETVVNNMEVGNNLDIQPEIRCRVFGLTSTLESFSVGHTIIMSRGLIDVLSGRSQPWRAKCLVAGNGAHRSGTQGGYGNFAFFGTALLQFDEKKTFQRIFGFCPHEGRRRGRARARPRNF